MTTSNQCPRCGTAVLGLSCVCGWNAVEHHVKQPNRFALPLAATSVAASDEGSCTGCARHCAAGVNGCGNRPGQSD